MKSQQTVNKNVLSIRNILFVLVALAVILICTFSFSAVATAKHTQAAQREVQTTYESIRISGGDSLWSIAQRYYGTTGTEYYVEQIKVLNGLSSDHIQAGAYILVPVGKVL